mmetsp:Transcript_7523/g.20950  ORF Transcript_7523/g.20950 Transcript_7523/m.20950 type:complete len:126 (-) Transcript_7523:327-704(-)
MRKKITPTKPQSAYNIFFSFQSKRYRERDRASILFHSTCSIQGKLPLKLNITQGIAKKWSKIREEEHFVRSFQLQSKERVDEYLLEKHLYNAEMNFASCLQGGAAEARSQSARKSNVSEIIWQLI